MPDPELSIAVAPPQLSRKCAACAEEEKAQATAANSVQVLRQADDQAAPDEDEDTVEDVDGLLLQRVEDTCAVAGPVNTVPQNTLARLEASRGRGEPLTPSLRRFFDPRLGHDFSRVRIHTDETAAELSRDLHAKAFVIGQDVYFGLGKFQAQPGHLLTHELVHTLQQQKGAEGSGLARRQPLDVPDASVPANAPPALQTPCPASVTLGTVTHRNFADQSPDDQAKFRTFLKAQAAMNVGPGPDHTGHCMKEQLTQVSNNCPTAAMALLNTPPCSSSKCLDINRFGSGPTAFLDEHRTKGPKSILEGTGQNSCTSVCEQIYTCDRKQPTTGKFRITRNFIADTATLADGTQINITTGRVEKTAVP
jgi:hypothetical protein